jgi:hypothetical protein
MPAKMQSPSDGLATLRAKDEQWAVEASNLQGLQLVTSERGVCGGPLAFHYANLMSHTAFRQSLACVSLLFQPSRLECAKGATFPPAVAPAARTYLLLTGHEMWPPAGLMW